jgi:Family of unknown function (DUF6527)
VAVAGVTAGSVDPGKWVDLAGPGRHRVRLLPDGGVLWEHDCPPGYTSGSYRVTRHEVSPVEGETWKVTGVSPLTLTPSLHCTAELGGCTAHGWVRDGRWEPC